MANSILPLLQHPALWRFGDVPRARRESLSTGFAALDAVLPEGGWPMGSLIEMLGDDRGIGEVSVFLPAMRRVSEQGKGIVFIAPPFLPYAPALAAAGIDLETVLIVRPAAEADRYWAAEQSMRCASVGMALAWLSSQTQADYTSLRRLQIAIATGAGIGVVFSTSSMRKHASPAPLRIAVSAQPGELSLTLFKRRGFAHACRIALDINHFGDSTVRPTRVDDVSKLARAGSAQSPLHIVSQ